MDEGEFQVIKDGVHGCLDCGNEKIEAFGRCGSCNTRHRKEARAAAKPQPSYQMPKRKAIQPVSEKRAGEMSEYLQQKELFLVGKKCPVYPELPCIDVHHKMGRVGYADQWARDNGITLLMDQRFWLGVSRKGHTKITYNPKWALEMGYSLPRASFTNQN